MKFELNDEQNALKTAVHDFLIARAGDDALQRAMDGDQSLDRDTWQRLAEQIGAQGLCIPEALGGSGAGVVESTVVLEEVGRRCYAGPYFSTLVATRALLACAETAKDYLAQIAAGTVVFTFAYAEDGVDWYSTAYETTASANSDGHTISGTKKLVTNVADATHFLVAATTDAGPGLFVVRRDASGLTVAVDESLDPTRQIGHLTFDAAAAESVGGDASVIAASADFASHALSAELIGVAAESIDRAVAWASDRIQFGRPIGSFQAIKTKCADALLELETARVLVYYAAYQLSVAADDAPMLVSLAKQAATDAAVLASSELIQILGAIGFTWEHPAHLYFKRARVNSVLLQDRNFHLDRVADMICN
ncbi:alkylation response protein AidB-like acyl-CoA dehydrogenase [Antricoccus suffuscus]|uniref:Alkylation response protein AidB-like acyl-CoA dehydrogenase n=1 Tax=Antricoccus suffuscus TaxID=1629062 RepID=A0A2T0ZWP6_9ACTN|nr:acyl-CoA dehydrogenase family protein [Antricoccus suffuscus]PRZ40785.1 alkylation response protein AidB-like acyl-CoA dehydrogenase [Antricoccus suffuscus]